MTTAASIEAQSASDEGSDPRRPGGARALALAVVVYAGALALITWWFPAESAFTSDDGAYAGQVHALRNGTWALERTPAVVPVEFEGWINAGVTPDGPIPNGWHPGYVRLLQITSLGGRFLDGLQIPSALGAIAAAALAWLIAERFRPGAGPVAFWLLALGPPIVNATAIWAHNLATALSALALYVIVGQTSSRSGPSPQVILGVLVAAVGPLFRTEVALWVVAMAVAVWMSDWLRHQRPVAALMAVLAVVTTLAERMWATAIYRQHIFMTRVAYDRPPLIRRLAVMVESLVGPSDLGMQTSWVIGIAAAMLLGAAVWLLRRRSDDLGSMLLAVGGLIYLTRIALSPLDRVKGLFLAWPAAACALLLEDQDPTEARRRFSRFAMTIIVVYTGAVFVTQHPGGAGLEWGGRYLASAYVALAVLAGFRLAPLWDRRGPLVAAAMLGPAALGLVVSYNAHQFNLRSINAVGRHDVDAVVSAKPADVRTSWSALPQPWFVATEDNVDHLLEILADAEIHRVALTGFDRGSEVGEPHYRVDKVDGSSDDDTVVVLVAD